MNIAKSSNGEELRGEYGGYHNHKMEEPKLFFVAIGLFDANSELNISENNYKDFEVLEIKFNDENYARKVTNGFADRYGIESKEAINIFAKPLEDRYTQEEISKLDESFYNFGYPMKTNVVNKYGHAIGWDEEKAEGHKLSYDYWSDYHSQGQKIINGYGDAKKTWTMKWNGKEGEDIGHFRLLKINKKHRLMGGASGSLYTDKEGNALGIYAGGEINEKNAFVIPLRVNERKEADSIKSPKYDLILGAPKQKSSYKEQIEAYGKNTWLKARNWEHKS
ncbi:hypothetical protein A6V39_00485 [Candidatus Mycoplasma haematobovis]|uniref:DUF31 domain-containing protein n=1 Tax=Candidatus Mycoplasma haematobovis TaxID=432608 RepID=A0A1A9QDH2_9MOLU|nr:hypothetical protein [Candidatus Mycoplasma haematobovis]OAL10527.1 hypothetical protein A6V39_00485 [Candidatus Mycoplasma haematobovis]